MKAWLEFLEERFRLFNHTIFADRLPTPEFHITGARTFVGQFRCELKGSGLLRRKETYHLTLSNRYDLPEDVVEDIVIHEMIHFFIHFTRQRDTSVHGKVFRTLMTDINRTHGRHISVSHRCTPEQLASDDAKAHSIVCLCRMTDGRRLVARVSQSKVFEIHKAFSEWDLVETQEWYWVYGSYFNRYRRVLSPRLFPLDEEGMGVIESGTRLEFAVESDGRMILRAAGAPMRR